MKYKGSIISGSVEIENHQIENDMTLLWQV